MADTGSTEKWGLFEVSLKGPGTGNPFRDVALSGSFSQGSRTITVPGFYDGDGTYRIRFMPDAEGAWSFRTSANVTALDGQSGTFTATAPGPDNHGPVSVRAKFHFAYADGTPFFPFGTTCYAWTHQPLELQTQTLETMAQARFNKLRMGVFPKHYVFNANEPLFDIFERDASGRLDVTRPNVAAFRHFETQVAALGKLGIEADIIVFHPYDRWGYCDMSAEDDFAYVRYLTARLAAYRNVWWSLANEYDFLLDVKPVSQWDRYFHIIEENDPYRHLKSIHNGEETMNFNHRKPWVDHVCIQNWNTKLTNQWRQEWGKPVVNDEPEYEGNILMAWGNLSAEELVHRFWLTVTRGGYAGHGETFEHPQDEIWWAKGGVLRGQSWQRIGFLRALIEEDVEVGLEPMPPGSFPWTRVSMAREGEYRLIYLGEHAPSTWAEGLPEDDGDYEVDVIDAWAMTVMPAERIPVPQLPDLRQRGGEWRNVTPKASFAVRLPGKPHQAIRVRPAR